MASPSVYFAMARDGVFFPSLAKLHPRYQTPALAILLQSAWALALLFTGKYEDLLNTVVFADWVFFGLTVAALFRLRGRFAERPGGFKTPGYPWLPAAFVLVAIAVVLSVIRTAPERSAMGVCLLALGIPVYYWSIARHRAAKSSASSNL
jgi:APA family basic amino acid/polyamine antiporter